MFAEAFWGAFFALLTLILTCLLLAWAFAPKGRTIRHKPSATQGAIPGHGEDEIDPHGQFGARMPTAAPLNGGKRLEQLAELAQRQKFELGQEVREVRLNRVGRIDAIYGDLQAAIDGFAIPRNWYQMQEVPPLSKPSSMWYSIVLHRGAILVGQDDLEPI